MEAIERTHNDVTTLITITSLIHTCINYQQILLHVCSILADLRDSLYYMRQIAMHVMDYIDASATGILSPHPLPVEVLQEMLIHIEEELPSTMHLPASSDDILHFYRYLHAHSLVAEEQFLLTIDVPIQHYTQQIEIYQVLNLFILKGSLSALYNIDTIDTTFPFLSHKSVLKNYLFIIFIEINTWENNYLDDGRPSGQMRGADAQW